MYPANFEYERPETQEEALELLERYGDEAKIIAGGASMVPLMKLRLATPERVIDIGSLGELVGESRSNGCLSFGAMVRHVDVGTSEGVRSVLPMLRDISSQIGDPQVRNMGTIGGAVAEVDPAGDWCPGLLALDASVRCVSKRGGEREIAARDLFLDAYTPAIEPEELLTEVKFPVPSGSSGGAHVKLERRAGDYPISCVSVQLTLDDSGRYERIGIGVGGLGLVPVKVTAVEEMIRGQEPDENLVRQAAREVSECTEAISDVRGTAEYRKKVTGALFRRALSVAERRAKGETLEVKHV